jgi:hypothetical protein
MPLRYRVFGEDEWRSGKTVNVSSSGVYFRCPLPADQGARVEMNFILLSSRAKESGLEVTCKGEIVRQENPLTVDCPSEVALAVKISDYRLIPFVAGSSNLEDPIVKPEVEESSKTGQG